MQRSRGMGRENVCITVGEKRVHGQISAFWSENLSVGIANDILLRCNFKSIRVPRRIHPVYNGRSSPLQPHRRVPTSSDIKLLFTRSELPLILPKRTIIPVTETRYVFCTRRLSPLRNRIHYFKRLLGATWWVGMPSRHYQSINGKFSPEILVEDIVEQLMVEWWAAVTRGLQFTLPYTATAKFC
jgi:hypothetical protein